jgi:hypothetical protein
MSSLISIAMISSPKRKDLKGDWKINTVLIGEDTLFRADSAEFTARFYKKNINDKEKSEAFYIFLTNCIKSTYVNLKSVTLTIKRRNYNQSLIKPCLDNFKHLEVEKGEYSFENDTLRLADSEMNLLFAKDQNSLVYKNHENNYEITYKKLN